jgi:hypothetical protein
MVTRQPHTAVLFKQSLPYCVQRHHCSLPPCLWHNVEVIRVNNVERQLHLITPQSELTKIFYLFGLFALLQQVWRKITLWFTQYCGVRYLIYNFHKQTNSLWHIILQSEAEKYIPDRLFAILPSSFCSMFIYAYKIYWCEVNCTADPAYIDSDGVFTSSFLNIHHIVKRIK